MKHHLQCAEKQVSPTNITKYFACNVKNNLMIDPRHIWNAIYNVRSNRRHPPTSPKTAPAKKLTLMIHPRHKWNFIYNVQSNRCHCPTSPNTVPATRNDSHDWSSSSTWRCCVCWSTPIAAGRQVILRVEGKMSGVRVVATLHSCNQLLAWGCWLVTTMISKSVSKFFVETFSCYVHVSQYTQQKGNASCVRAKSLGKKSSSVDANKIYVLYYITQCTYVCPS